MPLGGGGSFCHGPPSPVAAFHDRRAAPVRAPVQVGATAVGSLAAATSLPVHLEGLHSAPQLARSISPAAPQRSSYALQPVSLPSGAVSPPVPGGFALGSMAPSFGRSSPSIGWSSPQGVAAYTAAALEPETAKGLAIIRSVSGPPAPLPSAYPPFARCALGVVLCSARGRSFGSSFPPALGGTLGGDFAGGSCGGAGSGYGVSCCSGGSYASDSAREAHVVREAGATASISAVSTFVSNSPAAGPYSPGRSDASTVIAESLAAPPPPLPPSACEAPSQPSQPLAPLARGGAEGGDDGGRGVGGDGGQGYEDEDSITRSAASRLLAAAEGLQQQLDSVLSALWVEQRERELLGTTVSSMGRRLDEGLVAMNEAASAHVARDGATEAMLSALRQGVDDLRAQLPRAQEGFSPPPQSLLPLLDASAPTDPAQRDGSGSERSEAGTAPPLATLAEAVWQQGEQLKLLETSHRQQVELMQRSLQAQQQEFCQQVQALEAQQLAQLQQVEQVQLNAQAQHEEHRQQADDLAAWMAQQQSKLEEQLATVSDSASASASQVQALQAGKTHVVDLFRMVQEQQQSVLERQQEQEEDLKSIGSAVQEVKAHMGSQEALAPSPSGGEASSAEIAAVVHELRVEVALVAQAVSELSERVDGLCLQDPQNALQMEIGAIASVVSTLSERVERFDARGGEAASSSAPGGEAYGACGACGAYGARGAYGGYGDAAPPAGAETAATAQALRAQLGQLLSDVHRARSERSRPARSSSPTRAHLLEAWRAPSPRRWMNEPLAVAVGREHLLAAPLPAPGVLANVRH